MTSSTIGRVVKMSSDCCSGDKSTPSGWIESKNLDVAETLALYGVDKIECCHNKTTAANNKDDDSIISIDSGKDSIPLQDRVNSQLYISREMSSGKSLWKCPLSESDVIASHLVATSKLCHRLPCHNFRSLLPPLTNEPPLRGPAWLRHIMRGVLFAALQNYSDLENDCQLSNNSALRFPEFVYCWFEQEDSKSSDADRWSFYHELKTSTESNPESWLLFTLLDDLQGTDFLFFAVQVLNAVRNLMDKSWHHQFGNIISTCGEATEFDAEAKDVFLPVEISKEIAFQLFYSDSIKSSKLVDEVSNKAEVMVVDTDNSVLWGEQVSSPTTKSIDLFAFIKIVMTTYLSHKKKQVTLIRLMFETASKGVLTDFYDAQESSSLDDDTGTDLVNVTQLHQILKTVRKSTTLQETTQIYREAYDVMYPPSQWNKPAPDGIDFQSFLIAAERYSLFSRYE